MDTKFDQRTSADEDADGNLIVKTYQDVEGHLEYAKKMRRRDAEERGRFGRRGDFHHTMSIPFNVLHEVSQKHHLNFYDKDDAKKIVEIIARDYPYLKTTADKKV